MSVASGSSARPGAIRCFDHLWVECRAAVAHALSGVQERVDVEDAVFEQTAETAAGADEIDRVARFHVLRQDELVLVGGRHPHVHHGEVRFVLGDDGEQRVGIPDSGDDRMAGVFEQARETFA